MTTFGAAWRAGRDRFRQAGMPSAEREALFLARAAFPFIPREFALAETEAVCPGQLVQYEDMLARRLGGEPVARILGRWEFYGLEFELGPDALVPRPETELLVDLGLEALEQREDARFLDLGTGSGCIAISLLVEQPGATGMATDVSTGALGVARANASRLRVLPRLDLREGSWFDAVPADARFDLIVANPPYIERDVIPKLMREVSGHDPRGALDGGEDGLDAYRAIAAGAAAHLRPGALLALEIGAGQGTAVPRLLEARGFRQIAVKKDLAGLDRAILAHHV